MAWNDPPAEPAPTNPPWEAPRQEPPRRPRGLNRTVAVAGLGALLLVGGGVAAVSAASPDPSGSPAPSASTQPSDGGSGGSGGTTRPDGQHQQGDCPNGGGGNSGGSSGGSSDGSTDGGASSSGA